MRYYTVALDRHSDSVGSSTAESALKTYLPKKIDTLQKARQIRKAVKLLFAGDITVEIRSMDDRVI